MYEKPAAQVLDKYKSDVERTISNNDFTELKVVQNEPGQSDDEAFVAYAYK